MNSSGDRPRRYSGSTKPNSSGVPSNQQKKGGQPVGSSRLPAESILHCLFIVFFLDFVHDQLEFVRRVFFVVMAEVAGIGLFFHSSGLDRSAWVDHFESVQGNIPQDRASGGPRHMAADASTEVMDAVQRLLPGLGGSLVAIHAQGIARLFQGKPCCLSPIMDGMAGPQDFVRGSALHQLGQMWTSAAHKHAKSFSVRRDS